MTEPTTPMTTPTRFLKLSAVLNESHVGSDTDNAAEVGEETVHTRTEFLPVKPVLEPVQVSMDDSNNSTSNSHPATVCTNQTDEDAVPLPPLSCFQEIITRNYPELSGTLLVASDGTTQLQITHVSS